jgi:two-component system sensor histidine kinase/response regulator
MHLKPSARAGWTLTQALESQTSAVPAPEPAPADRSIVTPIVLTYASMIVACPIAVALLSLQDVFQQAAVARHVWVLIALQVVPLGVAAILIGVYLRHYVTSPLAEIDQAVRRYASGETDVVVPIHHNDEIGALGRNLDAMMRTLAKKQLRTEAVVDLAGFGICVVDGNGRYVQVNPALCTMLGRSEEELLETVFIDLVYPEDVPTTWEFFRQLIEERRGGYRTELRCTKADGSILWVAVTASLIPQADQAHFAIGMLEDITERRLADQALHETLALQDAILDNVNSAVMSTLNDGILRVFNKAAERMFGYRADEIIGKVSPLLLFPQEHIELRARQLSRELGRSIQPGHEVFYGPAHQWTGVRKDGTRFPILLSVSPYQDSQNCIAGYCGVGIDMTEQYKVQEELRNAKLTAEAASRAKSEFLANMSHEIRTPMNGILGMTELALDTELSVEQKEYVGTIKESAEALLTVINDILDFSKVEAGKLDLEPIPFDLRDNLERTIHGMAVRAEQRGLELACDIASAVPNCVIGDPDRLRQIVVNLVGNAIKFTEHGEVTLRVEPCEGPAADEKTSLLHFAVHDTGIGIPLEKQALIFNAFSQADGSTTRRFGGTGLGLTISSRLIELMKGRIWVESEVGRGSTFHFTAEFEVTEAAAADPLSARLAELNGLRVLAVDDNATNRRILSDILSNWHARPALAASGQEALTLLREAVGRLERFPIVLLDQMMPGMDGFVVAEEIRKDPKVAGATIIMLSSGRSGDALDRCRALGIAAYLYKPIRQSDLLRAMLSALAAGSRPRTAGDSSDASTVSESARGKSGAKADGGLRILLVEDNRINQRVARRMLEKDGHHVTIAEDGKKALLAIEQNTFDVVFMDVQMPEMDGLESTLAIRAREQETGQHLPIIAMTARAITGDRERCLASGMDDYVSKPVTLAELRRVLQVVRARSAAPLAFDEAAALARVDGDVDLLRELAAMLAEYAPHLLAQIGDAVAAEDPPRVEKTAHKLKGALISFCSAEAFDAARTLEQIGRSGRLDGANQKYHDLENHIGQLLAKLAEFVAAGKNTAANPAHEGPQPQRQELLVPIAN